MRRIATVIVLLLLAALSGCTAPQVRRHHGRLIQQITDLQYAQTLSNIAMFDSGEGSLPHIATLSNGTTVVADGGSSSVLLLWNPYTLLTESLNLNAARQLSEQFGATPLTDAGKLRRIRCAFELVTKGYDAVVVPHEKGWELIPQGCDGNCVDCIEELLNAGFLTAPDAEKLAEKGSLIFEKEQDALDYQAELLADLHCKLPAKCTCWYRMVSCKFVPHDAAYVGRFGKHKAYVTKAGIDHLSNVTLSIMTLATLEPTVPTVELRRLVKTATGEEYEAIGTAVGNIEELVTSDDFPAKVVKKEVQVLAPDGTLKKEERTREILPGEFKPLPPRTLAPLSIGRDGLIVTPNLPVN